MEHGDYNEETADMKPPRIPNLEDKEAIDKDLDAMTQIINRIKDRLWKR